MTYDLVKTRLSESQAEANKTITMPTASLQHRQSSFHHIMSDKVISAIRNAGYVSIV